MAGLHRIMRGIFISYRRADTAGHAGRLFDHLTRAFGDAGVFMDVDDIQRGDSFSDTLTRQLRQSDVLLAVIGRQWLTLTDADGQRRLDNDEDWVRSEIRSALDAGKLVIPVLVGGAVLPDAAALPENIRPLVTRQLAEVRDGSWSDDVARLTGDIKRRRARDTWAGRLREHWRSASLTAALAIVAGGYSAYTYTVGNRVVVPLVNGLTLERASQSVVDAGLQVGSVAERATNAYAAGTIIEQTPATQAVVGKGTAVNLTVARPQAVDLTRFVTVRDVGAEGTVAAAACVTAMDTSLAAQGRPTQLSLRYIYEKAKRHDEVTGEGTFLETTVYVARQFGAPPESLWPYRSLNRKMPPGMTWGELDAAAAKYKAQLTQVSSVDDVLGVLAKGMPVIVAATATKDWGDEPASRTGVVTVRPNPDALGATVITIVGFDPSTGRFKFANNWGEGWGDKGFGYFDKADAPAMLLLQSGLWSVSVPAEQP